MILAIVMFCIGTVVGAYSHKWLAAEVTKTTGLDPNVVAAKVNTAVKDASKKV